jgi:hypothetical protein
MRRFSLLMILPLLLASASARAQNTRSPVEGRSQSPPARSHDIGLEQGLGGTLTFVYRENQVEVQDKQGQVVFWIDAWARLYSPDLMLWQQDYNARLHRSFRSFLGGGLSAPEGIELVSPQPPGRRGIQSNGLFAVPWSIQENGLITRDTLSLTFFNLGIQWNYLAHYLASDCEAARASAPALNCRDYQLDWRASSEPLRTPPPDDQLLFGLRYMELQKGLSALRRLQQQLARVVTVTAQGSRADEERDGELYDARRAECLRWVVTNNCTLEAEDLRFPFDWLTAQVESARLSAELLDALHEAERDAQLSVATSWEYRELSRSYVDKAGRREAPCANAPAQVSAC